jgi:hypothetical protein
MPPVPVLARIALILAAVAAVVRVAIEVLGD